MTIPKQSGVYAIWRSGAEQCYIGSSQNIAKRWNDHRHKLRAGKASPRFQNAWNKYGESAFAFVVIELCSVAALLEREQYFIDALDQVFNAGHIAAAPARGHKHTPEMLAKMRGRVFTDEHRANMSAARMGKKYSLGVKHTVASKANMSAAARRRRPSPTRGPAISAALKKRYQALREAAKQEQAA